MNTKKVINAAHSRMVRAAGRVGLGASDAALKSVLSRQYNTKPSLDAYNSLLPYLRRTCQSPGAIEIIIPDDMAKAFHFIGPHFPGLKATPVSESNGHHPSILFVKTQFLYQLTDFIAEIGDNYYIHFKNDEWILISTDKNNAPLGKDATVQAVIANAQKPFVEGGFSSQFHVRPNTNDSQVVEEVRGEYFPIIQQWLEQGVFGDGSIHALDLGGHIGSFSVQLACLLGERVNVHVYEPEPNNFEQIKKNIELNGLMNVVPHNEAVSAKRGTGVLYVNLEHRGASKLNSKLSYATEKVSVPVVPFEQVLDAAPGRKIDLLKIDIEGSEYDTLLPIENLGSHVKAIVGEAQATDKYTPADLIHHLEKQGYKVEHKGTADLIIFSAIQD